MIAPHLSVIVLGLVLGYVVTSWLMSRRQGGTGPAPQAIPPTPPPARTPWHEVLQVPATASMDEIKLAYRRRIAEYHPDRTSGLADELRALAEEKSKLINAAYAEAMHGFGR